MILPSTTQRVPRHTSHKVNQQIHHDMVERVRHLSHRLDLIDQRLRELDREWDIERTLEANASTLMLIGTALGAFVDRRWLGLPGLVAGFLLQHAVQGWCPPVPIFRRLGVRTQAEIETEREALRALKGDYQPLAGIQPSSPRSEIEVQDIIDLLRRNEPRP